MRFTDILTLFGGLALFLYGMSLMGSALEKRAGRKLKSILSRLASNPLGGFLLGALVTGIIQSSCATTVMVVGFVNSGIMTLNQSAGIIIGANVGTAITSWILSLAGVEGSGWVTLFKPSTFTPVIALIGVCLHMFTKKERRKDTAGILLGFSVLMFGMETMSASVKPLGELDGFKNLLTMFSNPFLGVLVGMLFTMAIQSSSASVGIIQALSMTGAIHYSSVLPILFGFNIGTCITSIISASGASADAKRASMIHLVFNIISAAVILPLAYALHALIDFSFMEKAANPFGIAMVHSVCKLASAALLLPFSNQLVALSKLIIRDKADSPEKQMLDERLFINPSVALEQAFKVALTMSDVVSESFSRAISLLDHYSDSGADKVSEDEKRADAFEDMLGTYLVKLSEQNLSNEDSHELSELLHMIGDLERINDHAENIASSAREMHEKQLHFSEQATGELMVVLGAVGEAVRLALTSFRNNDILCAAQVEPLEQVVDVLQKQVRARHIERLTKGLCSSEQGFVLTDLLTDLERVSDHCSNVAGCVIETHFNSMDMHSYLNEVKSGSDEAFNERYRFFSSVYALPEKAY